MQWILYALANHREVQDKIVQEIDDSGGAAVSSDAERWQHLPMLKGAVKEAHRLYPVATFLTRILPNKCVIGNYEVPGQVIPILQFNDPQEHLKSLSEDPRASSRIPR